VFFNNFFAAGFHYFCGMKKTVFHRYHKDLGAKMVPFAGYEMPLEYSGVRNEHISVRTKAGLFDVSHMGEIWVSGPSAFGLVQRITSNDLGKLEPGKIQYTCFPNDSGGIVDDLLVYMYEQDKYLLVVNAANVDKDYNWIMKHNQEHATVENASDRIAQLAIQGPLAKEVLQQLTSENLEKLAYYHFITGPLGGKKEVIISNSGYTGAGGFELYMYNEDGPDIWKSIMEAGKPLGLEPCGLAARDTLRLEMGFCLYGNDITEETSPLEAGLGWITKFSPGNDFINRHALEQQKTDGIERRLVGFKLKERGIPRQHYPIFDLNGKPLGEVTSGTMSPMLGEGIGMGYVLRENAAPGTEVLIGIRNKKIPAEVQRPPFYQPSK
jgi:aminomethyltransferase